MHVPSIPRVLLGMLTPSSNTTLEPVTAAMLAGLAETSAHFGRFIPEVSGEQIRAMAREVAAAKPQAITIFCTNLRGGPLVADLERELGLPAYDSIATVVWKSLRLCGVDTRRVKGWGRLFTEFCGEVH